MSRRSLASLGMGAAVLIGCGVAVNFLGGIASIASYIEPKQEFIIDFVSPYVAMIQLDFALLISLAVISSFVAMIAIHSRAEKYKSLYSAATVEVLELKEEVFELKDKAEGRLRLLESAHRQSHNKRGRTQQKLFQTKRVRYDPETAYHSRGNWIESKLDELVLSLSKAYGFNFCVSLKLLTEDRSGVSSIFSDRRSKNLRSKMRVAGDQLDTAMIELLASDPQVRRVFHAKEISQKWPKFVSSFGENRPKFYEHILSVPVQFFDDGSAQREILDSETNRSMILGTLAIDTLHPIMDEQAVFEFVAGAADSIYEELIREISEAPRSIVSRPPTGASARAFLSKRWLPISVD